MVNPVIMEEGQGFPCGLLGIPLKALGIFVSFSLRRIGGMESWVFLT